MKTKMILEILSCLIVQSVFGRSFQTGHFVMTLTDKESRPITNATVYVKTLNRTGLAAGAYDSHYTTFSAQTGTNGIADVSFQFLTSHFTWWLDTPSHHSEEVGFRSDRFVPTIVKSDYWSIDTNTVEGLSRYNELKSLEDSGNYQAYAEKFEHKSVTYASNVVYRALSFFPKVNPQPMYAYGGLNRIATPIVETSQETNGYTVISYPRFEVDLEKFALLPPFNGDEVGSVSDFAVERYCVETNGVENFYGMVLFAPGCGAYKAVKTGDDSFPSAYGADPAAEYQNVLYFHVVKDLPTKRIISRQGLLSSNEYMVVRSRMRLSENGGTNGWHYSKIIGPISLGKYLSFGQCVFNPSFNDTNLEFNVRENLAGSRGENRWP